MIHERGGGEQRGLGAMRHARLQHACAATCTVSPFELEIRRQLVEEVLDLLRRVEPREQRGARPASAARAGRCGRRCGHARRNLDAKASARGCRAAADSTGLGVLPPPSPGGNCCCANQASKRQISSYFPSVLLQLDRISFLLQSQRCLHRRPIVRDRNRLSCPASPPSPRPRRSPKRTSICSIAWSVRRRAVQRAWLAGFLAGVESVTRRGAAGGAGAAGRAADHRVSRAKVRQFARSSPATWPSRRASSA